MNRAEGEHCRGIAECIAAFMKDRPCYRAGKIERLSYFLLALDVDDDSIFS